MSAPEEIIAAYKQGFEEGKQAAEKEFNKIIEEARKSAEKEGYSEGLERAAQDTHKVLFSFQYDAVNDKTIVSSPNWEMAFEVMTQYLKKKSDEANDDYSYEGIINCNNFFNREK